MLCCCDSSVISIEIESKVACTKNCNMNLTKSVELTVVDSLGDIHRPVFI
jgi:hypothetical protein